MLYNTIVQRDETGFNSIYEAAQKFEAENVLESILTCKFDQKKIEKTLNLLRHYQYRLNNESMDLVEFSENFIEQYATDHNECFRLADKLIRRIGTTMTGSMKIFRSFCPVVRRRFDERHNIVPVLDYSRLTFRQFQGQFFGVEPYIDSVKTLLHELAAFFFHLITTMKVCKDMIRKEEETRKDVHKLKEIFEKDCDEILHSVREVFRTFDRIQLVSEEELAERRKNAIPMEVWLPRDYHRYDRQWMKTEGIRIRIATGNQYGLDDEASVLWDKNPEWGQTVCKTLTKLDTLGLPYKNSKKAAEMGKKGTFDSRVMVYLLKWSAVSTTGDNGEIKDEEKERRFYNYCMKHYDGDYMFPTWQSVCRERKTLYSKNSSSLGLAKNFESYVVNASQQTDL